MNEFDEFSLENETINLLLQELTELIKHGDVSEQQGIDLINMCEALRSANGMRVTFNI